MKVSHKTQVQKELDGFELIKIQITHLLRHADKFAGIEVYVPVDKKFIKLNYADDEFIDILRKLQQKEVTEIHVDPEDCTKILKSIQESLSPKTFYDPNTVPEQRVEAIDQAMAVVKNIINQIGVNIENVRLLKTINDRSMNLLAESPSLYSFVKRFKKNCSEEFLQTTLTSYVMSLVIDKFDWKSDLVKEKGALASMLCDIVLEKNDFAELREAQSKGIAVPERLHNHPSEVADKLRRRRSLIPAETIIIIEQHHELPDGKGYPNGIMGPRFNQLSCIFIVSQQFTEALFKHSFDFEKRFEILEELKNKYDSKSFEKSIDALISVVG